VLCLDNDAIQELIPTIGKRFTTYGMNPQADLQATNVVFMGLKSRFDVAFQGQVLGEIVLNLPGLHNVSNALASIAVARELGIDFATIQAGLNTIEGVARRMEIKGDIGGVTVVDDYGHHPTEIRTTLAAVRESWPGRRVVVVFQPHRYSRTQALFDDFTRSFYQCDALVVLPIYAASESAIEGVSAESLSDGIRAHGHKDVAYVDTIQAAVAHLEKIVTPNDLVLTLGAGDVWKAGETLLDRLEAIAPGQGPESKPVATGAPPGEGLW
jgi:UDP-N-acetylmuramate--alanine ligase